MKINFREASTKRGIVWIIGGAWIVVQAFRGQVVDQDTLFNKLDFWLGVVMTVAGGFGLLPDDPKNVNIQLPQIERIEQVTGYNDASQDMGKAPPTAKFKRAGVGVDSQDTIVHQSDPITERRNPVADRLRQSVSTPSRRDENPYPDRFESSGWGDK